MDPLNRNNAIYHDSLTHGNIIFVLYYISMVNFKKTRSSRLQMFYKIVDVLKNYTKLRKTFVPETHF